MNYMLSLSILDPLYQVFGALMRFMYAWLQNYGLVIIAVNLAIKTLLLPVNMRMSKNMARQLFLQDDINEIKRVYANDPQKAQTAQMDLMKQHNVSMTGGCLPQILQLAVLIAIWRPIQQPLYYIAGVTSENLQNIAQLLVDKGHVAETALKTLGNSDVGILAALRSHGEVLAQAVDKGWIQLRQVLDLNFLGMDLGVTPSFLPAKLFGPESSTYLPLFLLVLVMVATMLLQLWLSRKSMPQQMRTKEEKQRDASNPAKQDQVQEQSACMMKSMNIMMPAMMIWMAFTLPAAMALFWLTSNIMGIIQSLLSYKFYTQPARELIEARKADKQVRRRRKNKSE